ncbi:retron Ec78 anti-phage system effector HNH endonuclease PtuB [Pseudoalteromonas sp. BZP1]|uniref:retron Ec78 anti-phage system effector HNH endonuclease PtuB n=1 Tax=unclassified Pseudoalteromonas TaxID=194690 RepID=UPI0032C48318
MRKIHKSDVENELSRFKLQYPEASWDDFRDYDQSRSYKAIKKIAFDDQFDICAYCEQNLADEHENNKRIEHFRSKSDTADFNIALDWFNLLGVCVGGSDYENKRKYELPANLSCDSHKAFLENVEKITDKDWYGKVLFPLELPEPHMLFTFDKSTGMLKPNKDYCENLEIEPNKNQNTVELVEETIRVFNLNCERLNSARLKVFYYSEKVIKLAREQNDKHKLESLINSWSRCKPLPFQTTRDIILSSNSLLNKLRTEVK